MHEIVICAPPKFSSTHFFFAGSFFSELVLILRQIWVSHDCCYAANGAANGAVNFAAADTASDEATGADDDGEEEAVTSFPGG